MGIVKRGQQGANLEESRWQKDVLVCGDLELIDYDHGALPLSGYARRSPSDVTYSLPVSPTLRSNGAGRPTSASVLTSHQNVGALQNCLINQVLGSDLVCPRVAFRCINMSGSCKRKPSWNTPVVELGVVRP